MNKKWLHSFPSGNLSEFSESYNSVAFPEKKETQGIHALGSIITAQIKIGYSAASAPAGAACTSTALTGAPSTADGATAAGICGGATGAGATGAAC